MLYLSDKIYVSYTPTLGQYSTYTVTATQYSGGSQTIFNGRVYGDSATTHKLYLNDIIASYCTNTNNIKPTSTGGRPTIIDTTGILQRFTVTFGTGASGGGTTDWVLSYYKDPNLPDGPRSTGTNNPLKERSNVLPRVPSTSGSNMFLPIVLYSGGMVQTSFNGWNGNYGGTKVADVDDCPAAYYLIWQDRTSGIQCQPFNGKMTYSENVNTTYRTDYLNEQVPYEKNVTGSWNLNTGWVTDEQYKVCASITTSPYIWVYDTKKDCVSCCNGADSSWVEKTWKNQKKLLNLNISVHSVPQNITY